MPKKWGQKLRRWLTTQLDLPEDIMMDFPRITMIGQIHVYIENHRGLLEFSENEIRILMNQGQLLITGKDLVIKAILPEELILEGKIDNVKFLNDP